MTRYADPRRCPDCRAEITPGATGCAHCGLPLRGQTAQDLFLALTRADELLVALRAQAVPVPVAAAPAAPATQATQGAPAAPAAPRASTPAPAPHRLSAASVPRILLTLGAVCLLVAALVFLAVTWQALGVAGRTLVLVGFTGVAAGLTAWSARRGLRAATEALGLVGLGLLVLDVVGGWHAGWLPGLETAGLLLVLGAVLAGVAGAAALAVRRTPAVGLTGGELVASVGVALMAAGVVGQEGLDPAVGLVLAVLLAAAATTAAHRLRLRVCAAGTAVVTGTSWLFLTGLALERLGTYPSVSALWLHAEVWPLLVAAALVTALAAVPALPLPARVLAVSVGWGLLGLAALGAVLDEQPTPVALGVLAVVAVTAAASWCLPRRWRLAGGVTLAVGGVATAVLALQLGAVAVGRLAAAVERPWTGTVTTRLPAWSADGLPAAWVLPLAVLVVLATALAGWQAVAEGRIPASASVTAASLAVGVATLVATLALYPVPLWAPVAVLAVAGGGAAAAWTRAPHAVVLGLGALALTVGSVVALVAEPLTAALLAEALGVAAVVRHRSGSADLASGAGLVLAVVLGAETWTIGALVDAPGPFVALAGLALLGALSLLPAADLGTQAGAAAVALPLAVAGVLTADPSREATWVSVYLTVAGVAVVSLALLRAGRRDLGWPGGGLLMLASWVRLADLGVSAPEAYSLPAAGALVVVGLWHLHRDRTSTLHALSAGLGLGLVPSLLWVLVDPEPLRALLLGLACFALVVAGVRARWTAPLVWGAGIGLAEVLRLAAPYVGSAVPRWLLIGVAGAVLVAMGVTWERRLADARHLLGYVRSLR